MTPRTWSLLLTEGTHLWLCNDEGPQAVVPNGTRYCQHAHDPHAIPEQDLAACCLHTRLQAMQRTLDIRCCRRCSAAVRSSPDKSLRQMSLHFL